jgi:hypothetical protein
VVGGIDMAFVRRFALGRRMRAKAGMELYNVFDAIGFVPAAGLGSTLSGWALAQGSPMPPALTGPAGE